MTALSLGCIGPRSAWAQSAADTLTATASSEWGTGYGAEAAADGIDNENSNYWQAVASKDRGAWWQADLGQIVPVRGVKVRTEKTFYFFRGRPCGVARPEHNLGGTRTVGHHGWSRP
jgi:hypothetical protein